MLRESGGLPSRLANEDVMSHCGVLNELSLRSAGNSGAETTWTSFHGDPACDFNSSDH